MQLGKCLVASRRLLSCISTFPYQHGEFMEVPREALCPKMRMLQEVPFSHIFKCAETLNEE